MTSGFPEHYGFHFEKSQRGLSEGPTDSAEEHFNGMDPGEALARELGQNSLDAKDQEHDGPVRMEFELAQMRVKEIPDFERLRRHVEAAAEVAQGIDEANTRLVDVKRTSLLENVWVLRVGDYGTTGLLGDESESMDSPLAALTRSKGVSSGKVEDGGSFGIGSAVGKLYSGLHTTLWTSLPKGSTDVVFAGLSTLSSHELDGTGYRADGIFTNLSNHTEFDYLRNPGAIGPFSPRKDYGTDTYLLGYSEAEVDPDLIQIRDAFIKNFFVAIHRGRLEIKGITPNGSWTLNSETLPELVEEVPGMRAFYRAITQNEPVVSQIKDLGRVELYIEVDELLEKKLGTLAVRKPLMKVHNFDTQVPLKYAAVFECSTSEGNKLLRGLEPARHDRWVAKRKPYGKNVLDRIRSFVRKELQKRVQEEIGEEVKIDGLNKLLPSGLGFDRGSRGSTYSMPRPQGQTDRESSRRNVSSESSDTETASSRKSHEVQVKEPATAQGDFDIRQGKRSGGTKKRKSVGGGLPGKGQRGEGNARIDGSSVSIRLAPGNSMNSKMIILRSDEAVCGDIELVGTGASGSSEDAYVLPIVSVVQKVDNSERELAFSKNVIKAVDFPEGDPQARLEITFDTPRRIRLGVK